MNKELSFMSAWLYDQLKAGKDLQELGKEVMQRTVDGQSVSLHPTVLKEEDVFDLKYICFLLGLDVELKRPEDLWALSLNFLGDFFIPKGFDDLPLAPKVVKGTRRAKRRDWEKKARQRLADIRKADKLKQIAVKDRGNGVYHVNKGHGLEKALVKKRTSKVVRKMNGKLPDGRFVHKVVPMGRLS